MSEALVAGREVDQMCIPDVHRSPQQSRQGSSEGLRAARGWVRITGWGREGFGSNGCSVSCTAE